MRLRTAPLAAALLTVSLGLTACTDSSNKGAGTSADSSAPTSAQSPAPDKDTNDNPDNPGSSKSKDKANPKGKNKGKNKGISASAQCTTAGLAFAVAPGSGAQEVNSPGDITITLTNKGTAPCSLNGYPGVDLVATPTGAGTGDGTWSLGRANAKKPQHVTLRPNTQSSFTITYLPYSAEGNSKDNEFKVSKIVVTPPGETHSVSLPWTFQPVLLQDGATHPGTYVGPVEPSSADKQPTTVRPPAPHKPRPSKRKTSSKHR